MMGGGPGGWPSGWDVYSVVLIAGALALSLPLALWIVSRILSRQASSLSGRSQGADPGVGAAKVELIRSENPVASGRKSNPRIFQALNAAFVLILLALLMIPCVVTLPGSMLGLVCVLSLSFVAGLALLYGERKRDLDWLGSWPRVGAGGKKQNPES